MGAMEPPFHTESTTSCMLTIIMSFYFILNCYICVLLLQLTTPGSSLFGSFQALCSLRYFIQVY